MAEQKAKLPKIKFTKNMTWKRGFKSKSPSTSMKLRSFVVIQGLVLLSAFALIGNLAHIMLVQHNEYTDLANSRQFGTITIPANRGTIYDAKGAVLA